MRRVTLGLLSTLCLLAGCSPTTVRVSFSTQDSVPLDTLTIQIGLDGNAPDSPKSLSASGLTSGSLLIPLSSDTPMPVTVTLSGETPLGWIDTATGTISSVAHTQVDLPPLVLTSSCGTFCDNFDDRTTVQGKWSEPPSATDSGNVAEVAISSLESLSAPHSLAFHAPAYADASVDGEGVTLPVTFPVASNRVSFDFDVMSSGYAGGTGSVNLMFLHLGSFQVIGLNLVATGYQFYEVVETPDLGSFYPVNHNVPPVPDGTWHHVHYAELFDEAQGSLVITWDGAVVVSIAHAQTWLGAVPTSATFFFDNRARGQTSAADIYFDNLSIK